MCRLAANCSYLVDKSEPWYSTKLDHLDELIGNIAGDTSRKCVLFSEWTRMLDLIEPLLQQHGVERLAMEATPGNTLSARKPLNGPGMLRTCSGSIS